LVNYLNEKCFQEFVTPFHAARVAVARLKWRDEMAMQYPHLSGQINRRQALCAMGAAALVGIPSEAVAAPEVGHVMAVSGQGYAGNTPIRRLQAEDSLQMGDRVWTETESRASLMLDLGAVVHMGPEAHLILDRFVAESRGVLTLGSGAIVFDRDDELPRINLQILSAFAQIGLRGTRFFAGPNRDVFAIFVERGRLTVAAGGARIILRAGDGVDIAAPGARASEVTRWQPPRIAEAFESVLP
jgi:ferric-dicitrate binding protein FerR (iron transport regulator)